MPSPSKPQRTPPPHLWTALFICLIPGCMDTAGDGTIYGQAERATRLAYVDASVVIEWNQLAQEIAYGEDQFRTFKGQRALAMMNLAMHDALNTIVPKYERHVFRGSQIDAEPELAAAHSAYAVMRSEYPTQVTRMDSLLDALRLRSVRELGTSANDLGSAAANAVLRARVDDGWDKPGTYEFVGGAGQYQTTPDWRGFVLQPGFRHAKPFAIRAPDAFRPPAPPPLTSAAYGRAYDEVKRYGALTSSDRTADQSAYAFWWLEFAEGSVNRLARRLVSERSADLWSAARLFALLHMALYDGYIATWDAKYEYNHWRPFTAIRVTEDGNRTTQPDGQWQSLLPVPPFPEYVSAHAVGCAASFAVLAEVFSDKTTFSMTTSTAPAEMPRRSFASFSAAANECADSRVRLGWHFRYATDAGLNLGQRVARHVLRTQLRPK